MKDRICVSAFLHIVGMIAFLALCLAWSPGADARPRTLEEALDSLDASLERYPEVLRARYAGVDSLKSAHYKYNRRKLHDIAKAYRGLDSDSSLHYYSEALEAPAEPGDLVSHMRLHIEYAGQLGSIAHYQEAMAQLDSVDRTVLTPVEKMLYFDVHSRTLLDAMSAAASSRRRAVYRAQARASLDSLYEFVKPFEGGELLTRAMMLTLDGDSVMAAGELYQAIGNLESNSPLLAISSDLLASLYRHRPDKRQDYLYFLAIASGADARVANGEAYSLELLGSEMFKEGDFNRALNYLTVAGEAMQRVGARKRLSDDAPPLSVMLQNLRVREHNRHVAFIVTLCLLALVVVSFIVVMIKVVRQDRALRSRLDTLTDMCDAKDRYIAQLFDLCAGYIDATEDFNRLVSRKIKANQTKDLYETVESGKIMKQMSERFYENFDRAVLHICPDFVDEINALLAPDRRIEAPESGRLSPELRIAAFMRLGVDDSARIAKFLGLSLNTVYTYRNRMKSRALDRENFENELLKIG